MHCCVAFRSSVLLLLSESERRSANRHARCQHTAPNLHVPVASLRFKRLQPPSAPWQQSTHGPRIRILVHLASADMGSTLAGPRFQPAPADNANERPAPRNPKRTIPTRSLARPPPHSKRLFASKYFYRPINCPAPIQNTSKYWKTTNLVLPSRCENENRVA